MKISLYKRINSGKELESHLFELARMCLSKSLEFEPNNYLIALDDPDFSIIKRSDWFNALIYKYAMAHHKCVKYSNGG